MPVPQRIYCFHLNTLINYTYLDPWPMDPGLMSAEVVFLAH
jgi:hypothetical protein